MASKEGEKEVKNNKKLNVKGEIDQMKRDQLTREEFRHQHDLVSFETLRGVEWQAIFQTYAGYGAIAIAFETASNRFPNNGILFSATALFSLLLFAISSYFQLRVIERIHWVRTQILTRVGRPVASESVCNPFMWFGTHTPPIHQNWYAFRVQLAISLLTVVGIVAYAYFATWFTTLTNK